MKRENRLGSNQEMGTQGEIATKPKTMEEKDTQKGEKLKNRKYLQHITGGGYRTITGRKRTTPNCQNK